MNLRNVLGLATVVASLAVPSIASAQHFGRGGMGGWRDGSAMRAAPVYNRYAAPVYRGYATPVYNPAPVYYPPTPVYTGYSNYSTYAAPVYRGWERGREGWGREGGWGGWGRGRR